jgi:hypothetical protein
MSRTVEDLQPGDVLEVDGVVLLLEAITPPPAPGWPYLLSYQVLALPDGSDPATLEHDGGNGPPE